MSKNKLFWIFAMVLLVAIPTASAQVLGMAVQNWYYLLINALVIGAILFILQAILVPEKTSQEKGSIWVIIVIVSLLLAWFNGREGLIWKTGAIGTFFATYTWYFVLVNVFVIGVVLYFVAVLLLQDKLQSTQGKIGLGILIAVLSILIAVKIGNQWAWSTENVKIFRDFLFGPEGILTLKDNRLWVFVTSLVLLSFFFNGFLMEKGEKKLNYALALLFAANMARSGVSLQWVLRLGEILFLLIFQRSLQDSVKNTWARWLISIFLVGWASYAVSSGTDFKGLIGATIGLIVPATFWTFTGIMFVGLAILITFVVYKIISSVFESAEVRNEPETAAAEPDAPPAPPATGAPAAPPGGVP